MTRLSTDDGFYTLVNVFTVAPADQEKLYRHLTGVTEEKIRHMPGFVSANFHLSHDGTQVVNYAQWESEESFRAMHADPGLQEHFAFCRGISSPKSIPCTLSYVAAPTGGR
ncbi:antibiotic biosynthesis monooxygenase family protein [Streptomyces abikoensis]|uniref:antibiotic biosynthesis monooxygenase family protein n=1 Tax=Streptomyces abikoensis TaxID=97398 RepID=UPI0016779DF0|nr:antibiotic biosynthesis monooxygenase family protein [Streptomyces abikoensis]GGP51297.1 antibiotic biosynthesis monooxygenase [Streptomyces abikoensis]